MSRSKRSAEKRPPLTTFKMIGDIPQALLALVRRMLAKSANDRYASMAEVRADLARLVSAPEGIGATGAKASRVPLIGRSAEFNRRGSWRLPAPEK